MFVWNLHLYTMKRDVLCISHMVDNLNSIYLKQIIKKKRFTTVDQNSYGCLGNSCSPGVTVEGKQTRAVCLLQTAFTLQVFPAATDAYCANNTHNNGKPSLFEVSQQLHNPFKFSGPVQVLID